MRALECSGPCPSKPCGRSSTRPERRSHLSSAETMNWSMMTCARVHEVAELRLPDDELVRAVEAVAVLEAEHARLAERAVVDLEAAHGRRRLPRCASGVYGSPVSVSKRTAWRWRERPAARVLAADADAVPFERGCDANARCSPVPQSSAWPASGALAPLLDDLERLRVRVEAVGHRRRACSSASSSCSLRNAVGDLGHARVGPALVGRPDAAHRVSGMRAGSRPCAPPRAPARARLGAPARWRRPPRA